MGRGRLPRERLRPDLIDDLLDQHRRPHHLGLRVEILLANAGGEHPALLDRGGQVDVLPAELHEDARPRLVEFRHDDFQHGVCPEQEQQGHADDDVALAGQERAEIIPRQRGVRPVVLYRGHGSVPSRDIRARWAAVPAESGNKTGANMA